ncbi:MAG: LamG-like jellyroll fold domain-containing protein [Rubripirellula sp.]
MNDLRFTELVSNWLDGSLTEPESQELQSELEGSAKRRSEFADHCGLDVDLRLLSDDTTVLSYPQDGRTRESGYHAFALRANTWSLVAAIGATLLLAIGYGIGREGTKDSQKEIALSDPSAIESNEVVESGCAVLSRIVDAQFAGGIVYREGDSLPPGPLELISGAVQVDFFSGATMLIDEATEVYLVDSWEAECVRGKVTMHVPPPAIGFRLMLPGMKVVDLGTEFGVEVDGTVSSLHVFDGEVEAHVPGSQVQVIREGKSLDTSADRSLVSGEATPSEFPNAREFEQRVKSFHQRKSGKWWGSMKPVRTDPRILGCYLFKRWEDDRWDRLINNFALPKKISRSGSAVGTRWVEGRWPTKDAMEFKSPGDRVRINLGKKRYNGLTMASWVRVDGLDRKYNALLMSDGYEDGKPHWQIDQSGRLVFSVNFRSRKPSSRESTENYPLSNVYYSPPIFNAAGRRWHHVAVTYDSATAEAVQYFDGIEVSREVNKDHSAGRKVTFGTCEIGNWGLPLEGVPFPVRNLNGRMDEFLIYQESLTATEIANLYELGISD